MHTIIQLLFCSLLFVAPKTKHKELNNQLDTNTVKTKLTINYPNNTTVWESPSKVSLKWDTKNIPSHKTIKFYLSKDDMVVQELGIFDNTGFAENVDLDRGLTQGENYRVIGIELFPDDKYNIAKFATPFFTINKKPRPEQITKENNATKLRDSFDGRKLNYVKELSVASPNIIINIWDHGRKDGDVVSIYLNGEAIISKYALEYYKKAISVTLDSSKPNDLFLYAHNLGKYPPNTVSIEVVDGDNPENIILNSDLKSCEAVSIKVAK